MQRLGRKSEVVLLTWPPLATAGQQHCLPSMHEAWVLSPAPQNKIQLFLTAFPVPCSHGPQHTEILHQPAKPVPPEAPPVSAPRLQGKPHLLHLFRSLPSSSFAVLTFSPSSVSAKALLTDLRIQPSCPPCPHLQNHIKSPSRTGSRRPTPPWPQHMWLQLGRVTVPASSCLELPSPAARPETRWRPSLLREAPSSHFLHPPTSRRPPARLSCHQQPPAWHTAFNT